MAIASVVKPQYSAPVLVSLLLSLACHGSDRVGPSDGAPALRQEAQDLGFGQETECYTNRVDAPNTTKRDHSGLCRTTVSTPNASHHASVDINWVVPTMGVQLETVVYEFSEPVHKAWIVLGGHFKCGATHYGLVTMSGPDGSAGPIEFQPDSASQARCASGEPSVYLGHARVAVPLRSITRVEIEHMVPMEWEEELGPPGGTATRLGWAAYNIHFIEYPECPPASEPSTGAFEPVLSDAGLRRDLLRELELSRPNPNGIGRVERGGWIYRRDDGSYFALYVDPSSPPSDCGFTIGSPPPIAGAQPVAPWHTHPSESRERYYTCPGLAEFPNMFANPLGGGGGSSKDWEVPNRPEMMGAPLYVIAQSGQINRLDAGVLDEASRLANANRWTFDRAHPNVCAVAYSS